MLACSLLLSACGGGGEAAAPPATDAAAAPIDQATDTAQAQTDANAETVSATEAEIDPVTGQPVDTGVSEIGGDTGSSIEVAPGSTVKTSDRTPGEFVNALGKKQIIVVLYQPDTFVGTYLLEEATAAAKAVDGTVHLTYTPAEYEKYGDLAANLGLFEAPSVAIVNRSGELQNFWSGYVDRKLLGRVLTTAAEKEGSSVTADDAPTAGAFEVASDTAVEG